MAELLSTEQWKLLEREIADTFGLNPSIQDEKGAMVVGGKTFGNPLCKRIRTDPKGVSAICSVAGQFFSSTMRDNGKPLVSECDAGMTKIAVPVIVDGQYIGSIGCCGAVQDEDDVEGFMVARSLGVDEEDLSPLMENMPTLTSEQAEELKTWLENKVAEIVAASKQSH